MLRSNMCMSSLAVSLMLGVTPSLEAASPIQLQHASFHDLQQQFELSVPNSKAMLSNPRQNLQFLKQHTDKNKMNHIRMQQFYEGFPVYGGYAIFHSPQSVNSLVGTQNDVKMNGTLFQSLTYELGQPDASFLNNAQKALRQFKTPYLNYTLSEEKVTPMVYIDEKNKSFWAYRVSLLVEFDDKIPERPTAIVDAKTFKPLIKWNDLKTNQAAQGVGFQGNALAPQKQYGKDLPFLLISRDPATNICFMENFSVSVVDMEHTTDKVNKTMQFTCKPTRNGDAYWTGYKHNGYDKINGAYSPTNDALYTGMVIDEMYKKWIGIPPLTKNGKSMQMVMRVHYGKKYGNAFWDGQTMTFGDGDDETYPLVSLGIGAHEISHGFTEQHSDLQYYGQSGAMNESFSDMASVAAEFYSSLSNKNWDIGSDVMKPGSGQKALRYMDKPSRDGNSIDRADQYRLGLNVHYASGVYNRFFYLLAKRHKWGTRKTFTLMVKANRDYWTPTSTFAEGGCGVLSAARDLKYPIDDVKKSLTGLAISYQGCNL